MGRRQLFWDGPFVELTRIDGEIELGIALTEGDAPPRGAELFEQITPSGLSCASCHPEGGDDGHVWRVGDDSPVRTQTTRGGVMDTAPFHWRGDIPNFLVLAEQAFARRMSGDPLSIADITDLERFVEAIPALPPPHADAAPRDRGRAIFESAEAACQTCHSGSAYTSGATVDIGTRGGAFQVAVLLGVGYRAPYMHDGCARALREVVRGDDACRGGAHGRTSHLSDGDIDDLVTYLRSL